MNTDGKLINSLHQPAWAILVKLGEINMIPLIILNKAQSFITNFSYIIYKYIVYDKYIYCITNPLIMLNAVRTASVA